MLPPGRQNNTNSSWNIIKPSSSSFVSSLSKLKLKVMINLINLQIICLFFTLMCLSSNDEYYFLLVFF